MDEIFINSKELQPPVLITNALLVNKTSLKYDVNDVKHHISKVRKT